MKRDNPEGLVDPEEQDPCSVFDLRGHSTPRTNVGTAKRRLRDP